MQNIFKGIKNFLKKSVGDDSSYSSLVGGGFDTPLAHNTSPGNLLAQNKNWVYVCVNKIATTMAGVNLHLKRYNAKGDDMEIYDSPVLKLLNKPNSFMTGNDLMYMIVGHMQITGNAYLKKDKAQNPTSLVVLNPAFIKVVTNKEQTQIEKYQYRIEGKTYNYPVEEIIHLKRPNLSNPFTGAGVLQHIPEWIDIDSAALEFNRLFFKNGSSISGIVETDATDMKALELARAGFEMRYQGALNAHKTAFMPRNAKYVGNSATPRDMEFSEADTRFRDKILSAFGMPKSVLGIVDDVNRANAEASYFVFMMFKIDPEMKMLVAYLNEWLLPSFSNSDNLYFTYENIIPENEDFKLRKLQASLAGQAWVTPNEARAEDGGRVPITNGDSVLGGFATIPIGSPIQTNNIETPKEKSKKFKTERIQKSVQKDTMVESIVDKLDMSKFVKTIRDSQAEEVHKQFISRVSKYESTFAKAVKKFDTDIKDEVIKNIEDGKKDFISKKSLFDVDNAQKLFIGLTSPILQDLIKTEGQAQMDRLDTTTAFSPLSERVQAKLAGLLKFTANSYTETTTKLLQSQLAQGVENGESLPELTQRVASVFDLTEQYRAERTARTTVFATANDAAREAYKQSGVVKTVVWHTAEDELVCEFCGPYDGKEVDIDAGFGDTEDPPLHVNCRCFTNAGEISVERDVEIQETKQVEKVDEETAILSKLVEVLEND